MKTTTKNLNRELKEVMRLRHDQIDTSDIPEVTDWSKAIVGKFFRSIKKRL
jgi:hypothetical protein